MTDPGEVEALKAAMRGARQTGDRLRELSARVEVLDSRTEIPRSGSRGSAAATSAHAMAAQALRGLVQTILRRRGKIVDEVIGGSSGGDAE